MISNIWANEIKAISLLILMKKGKQKRKKRKFKYLFYLMTGKCNLELRDRSWNQLSALGPAFKTNDYTNLPKLKYSRLEQKIPGCRVDSKVKYYLTTLCHDVNLCFFSSFCLLSLFFPFFFCIFINLNAVCVRKKCMDNTEFYITQKVCRFCQEEKMEKLK